MSQKANKTTDYRIFRVASLMLVNAMLFQEIIAKSNPKVKNLRQTLAEPDSIGEFCKQWQYIIDSIDFIPIFKVAQETLMRFPSSAETKSALDHLAQISIDLSINRAALRHDLMGRIFHKLLSDAKYFGAFYTKIPAATMLLKLSMEEGKWDIDWSDLDQVSKITVGDFACGTGTLLKAALISISDLYIQKSITKEINPNPENLHKLVIENGIWGFDVLTSAAHLAATAIALHDPEVKLDKIHLYALPLGGPRLSLGSIDFAGNDELLAQQTFLGATVGAEAATGTGENATSIDLPAFDIITMNPPFTRNVYGNLLFGNVGEERADLQAKLGQTIRKYNLKANITAGLGSVFVAIADKKLKKNGILSLVLPKTTLNGSSWEPTREIFNKYNLLYLISSHEPTHWSFSESSKLSEILLILQRKTNADAISTKCINLWCQPKNAIEALNAVSLIQNSEAAEIQKETGICELKSTNKKFGEMISINFKKEKIPFEIPVAFAQTELNRMAYFLSKGIIFYPSVGIVGKIPLIPLNKRAELGPDGRDVYDGFDLTNKKTIYEAFWGIDSDKIKYLSSTSNQYLSPLQTAKSGRPLRDSNLLWSRSGSLMLVKELWLPKNSISAVTLENKALSNVWWPTKWINPNEKICRTMEKRLTLWLNSTLGIFSLIMSRQETRGPWIKFPKAWWENCKILDLTKLNKKQNDALDALWASTHNKPLSPFPSINNDPVRDEIDDTICGILNVPSLKVVQNMLANEPIISDKAL